MRLSNVGLELNAQRERPVRTRSKRPARSEIGENRVGGNLASKRQTPQLALDTDPSPNTRHTTVRIGHSGNGDPLRARSEEKIRS
jgi:hypothetical protein